MVLDANTEKLYPALLDFLTRDKLLILLCDTIYGIIGRYPRAAASICSLKQRPHKHFIHLVANMQQYDELSGFTLPPEVLEIWPAALSCIVPSKDKSEQIAVRMPANPLLQRLCLDLGVLYSSSVNIHGQEPISNFEQIVELFDGPDILLVDSGNIGAAQASTVINLCSRPRKLIRQGLLKFPSSFFS